MERPLLLELPAEVFDACETAAPRVDSKSLVTIRQNRYSVPVALAGLKVSARIGAREITINHGGREVARHERMHGKFGTSAQLDHYLELLARKPGGLEHSLALSQERDRGAWPDCLDELWAALIGRYGRSDAARQMVDVVLLCRDHGPARVELAVRGALAAGAIDGRAVAVLARRAQTISPATPGPLTGLAARLQAHQRPVPDPDRLRPAARRNPMTTPARNAQTAALEALIEAHAIELKLPTVRRRFKALAAEALARAADPGRLPRRAARSRDRRARRAPREAPTDRRTVPADQTPRGLPVRRQPQRPAGHDRRPGGGIVDR